jgi:RimJ/RimL family protein N-acetyltransferase
VSAPPLVFERLLPAHVDELAAVLRNDEVYRHIGGTPSPELFRLRMQRALAGPPAEGPPQRWINWLVRLKDTGAAIGRLEATVIATNAEVAFLFDPAHWGAGHARRALAWLHGAIASEVGPVQFWATTVAQNTKSRRLLEACGYETVAPEAAPRLVSYDDGDLVYRLARASSASNPG